MLLYDIIYPGNSMDRAIPLSSASEVEGAKAQCVNGDPRDQQTFRGAWVADYTGPCPRCGYYEPAGCGDLHCPRR